MKPCCPELRAKFEAESKLHAEDVIAAKQIDADSDEALTGRTALHLAASHGCYRALRVLLSHADADLLSPGGLLGQTPLHMAARRNDAACVHAILADGRCDARALNCLDRGNETPLMRAVRRNAVLATHLLCQRADLDVGVKSSYKGFTALHLATMRPELAACMRVILRRGGVSTSLASDDGCTPLHAAMWFNNGEAVRVLLTNPLTDVNFANKLGWSPLTMGLRALAQNQAEVLSGGSVERNPGSGELRQHGACQQAGAASQRGGADADDAGDVLPWAEAMLRDAADDSATVASDARSVGSRSTGSAASVGHAPAASVGGSGRRDEWAATEVQARLDAYTAAAAGTADLIAALHALICDLRVDLTRREAKRWAPFPKDALAVARKYKLHQAVCLLEAAIKARHFPQRVQGMTDPKLAAWFSARSMGVSASSAVLACGVGVKSISDLLGLAELVESDESILASMDMPLLDRQRLRRGLASLWEQCGGGSESADAVAASITPRSWAEEGIELEAAVAAAVAAASAAPEAAAAGRDGGGAGSGGGGDDDDEAEAEAAAVAAAVAGGGSAGDAGGDAGGGDEGTEGANGGADGGGGEAGGGGVLAEGAALVGAEEAAARLDLPLRSLLSDLGVLGEAAPLLLALRPPVTDRVGLAALSAEAEAEVREALPAAKRPKFEAAVAEARQLRRHQSGVASEELRAFLGSRGLDEETWAPVLLKLGARRPSHLIAVRREHLEGESIAPLQREAFFRAVEAIDGAGKSPAAAATADRDISSPAHSPAPPATTEPAQPTTLIGFVNYWLSRLYADRPAIAITLIVLIIGAIVAGVVTGSLAATDVIGGDGSAARLLRGSAIK